MKILELKVLKKLQLTTQYVLYIYQDLNGNKQLYYIGTQSQINSRVHLYRIHFAFF